MQPQIDKTYLRLQFNSIQFSAQLNEEDLSIMRLVSISLLDLAHDTTVWVADR